MMAPCGIGVRAAATAVVAAALALGTPPAAYDAGQDAREPLPRSALRVQAGSEWRTWWSSERAPARWTSAPLADAVTWEERGAPSGLEWGTIRLAGTGEAWRLRVVLVRLDPTRFRFDLPRRAARDGRAAWTIDSASADAVLALNAGQFARALPWGWLVRSGQEVQPPGSGPLAAAFVVDSAGRASIVPAESIAALRTRGTVRLAFQSYPAALVGDGEVVPALRAAGGRIDVAHRDARLAIGELRDGRLLIALTRFDAAGEALQALPFGLTAPEMAALMGALGARRALLLDGGISAQVALRDADGRRRSWRGLRPVPMGLEALPR